MSGRLSSGLLAVLLGAALLLAVAPTNALGLFTGSRAVAANSISTNTLAPPTGLAASVSGTSVSLTWTATPSSFASGYDVLRSTISGGPYTQIAQVTPRTTLTYVDSTVTAGTTYYYVLRAYYQSWLSTSTAQVSATPCTPSVVQSAVGGGTAGSFSATFPAVPGSGRLLVAVAATRNSRRARRRPQAGRPPSSRRAAPAPPKQSSTRSRPLLSRQRSPSRPPRLATAMASTCTSWRV